MALVAATSLATDLMQTTAGAQGQLRVPRFVADPMWNKPLPKKWTTGQVSGVAVGFSPDKEQRFLYVVDGSNKWVRILNRKTLEIVDSVGGRAGHGAQEFFHIHSMAVDSKGNIYLGEVNQGSGT